MDATSLYKILRQRTNPTWAKPQGWTRSDAKHRLFQQTLRTRHIIVGQRLCGDLFSYQLNLSTIEMGDSEVLEPYRLAGPKKDMLDQSFTDASATHKMLPPHKKRPTPSKLRSMLDGMFFPSEELKQATYRSISRA